MRSRQWWIAAVFFWVSAFGSVQAQDLSADAQAIVDRVRIAIESEIRRQATLPAPESESVLLQRLGLLDQAGRSELDMQAINAMPASERSAARSAAYRFIQEQDRANQAVLDTLDPVGGWWTSEEYGPQAASAAFLIVQHGGEDLWREYLPILQVEAAAGRVHGEAFAQMSDRLALVENRPQLYGTQVICDSNQFSLYRMDDRRAVERRRNELRMAPLGSFEEEVAQWPAC